MEIGGARPWAALAAVAAASCFYDLDSIRRPTDASGAEGPGGDAQHIDAWEGDRSPCTGSLACTLMSGPASAPCNNGPQVGSCVAPEWVYCQCGGAGGIQPALFVEPPMGSGQATITLVAGSGLTDVTLQVDGVDCLLAPTVCALDPGACGGSNLAAYSWTWTLASGMHRLRISVFDAPPPCDSSAPALLDVLVRR